MDTTFVLSVMLILKVCPLLVTPVVYFDINSYMKYSQGTNVLLGGDSRLSFSFKFCNPKGILLYQNRPNGYFAIGINNKKVYIEWKMSNIVVELYVGGGTMESNRTYVVDISNLNDRQKTSATINGSPVTVEYLIVLDERLNLDSSLGEVYVGGFVDVSLLPVNTERISAYLTICLDYVETIYRRIDLTQPNVAVGVYNSCPIDFCAPPTTITATSTSSYVRMNVTVKARTRTQISFRFRTRAQRGMLFYMGGPAYMTLFLVDGGYLGLGLNTKAEDSGAFGYSSMSGFNDGHWKYVQVIRADNVANVTSEQGYLLITTKFGVTDSSGYSLNADSLMIAGTSDPLPFLPAPAQVSTPGCFEAPRFASFSIASEPSSLLNFDTRTNTSKDIMVGQCYSNITCQPSCPLPSQYCDLTCTCSAGFQATGQNPLVCSNIDDCNPNPCRNGASCFDMILGYNCQCTEGFVGKNCTDINYCTIAPCKNGATCTNTNAGFVCVCGRGFEGDWCEKDIDECASNPCHNLGTCTNLVGGYRCYCLPGYFGTNCELDLNECQTGPCLNGATCYNTVGSFYCVCLNGFAGNRCETNTNECASSPCLNGGVCMDGIASYSCQCRPGFAGLRCENNINECSSFPCLNNGICNDGINMYTCACLPGYTGVKCETDIDECASNPCRNNGTCVNLINGFLCQCPASFIGPTCDVEVNECSSNPCQNNGACVDRVGFFVCVCPTGWTGTLCNVDVDECVSNPCSNGGTCSNGQGFYRCYCPPGYTDSNCQTNINECTSNPCLNGGTCTDLVNSYRCSCPSPFTGTNCVDVINLCLSFPCRNGATCNNLIGSFLCTCLPGYTGTLCQADIDECASNPCLNNGVCLNRVNAFYCQCPAGFVGTTCEMNYNECLSNPCINGVCQDGIGTYSCICSPGWQGFRCDQDIDECSSTPCFNNASCENLQNRYRCNCPPGFEGQNCEMNPNECYIPSLNKCANGATCVDGIGRYTCVCAPGWTGQYCDQDLNECISNPCLNGGACTNLLNGFHCTCQSGFEGRTCAQDVDECALNVCRSAISCKNTYGSYACTCQTGYTGKNCDSLTNLCSSYTCHFGGTCEVVNNKARCLCLPDYMGDRCEAIIRHCNYTYPCKNNAVCQNNQLGGYQCFCKAGFEGVSCQDNINECYSNPCYNGATCHDEINAFRCICSPGYTGQTCSIDIDECFSQPCQNGGTCQQPRINMYQCLCVAGYTGTNCEHVINNCASNPCQTWQICANAVNSFTCSCPDGFSGERCAERTDKCHSQPCQNGGTCQMTPSGSFSCLCPFPWGGSICDTRNDACYPNPCLNYGTCFRNGSIVPQGYFCLCQPGFIGERCQGDIYSCFSNPCKNGATCSGWFNGTNGFTCGCPQYFTGIFCDVPISGLCASFPCLNNGTCFQVPNGFTCSCPLSWTGSRCETDVNECDSAPCLNGGVCRNTEGSFQCSCQPGWTGATCSLPSSSSTSDNCTSNSGCPANKICVASVCCSSGVDCPNPCNSNPCRNDGICQGNLNTQTFSCKCPSGFGGVLCNDVTTATFNGNNGLNIAMGKIISGRRKRQTDSNLNLKLSFLTTYGEGLILYIRDNYTNTGRDYLLIELHSNFLRIEAEISQEQFLHTFLISSLIAEPKDYVNVSVTISSNSFVSGISPCQDPLCGRSDNISNGTFVPRDIELGWSQSWTPFERSRIRSKESFRGCLTGVLLNGKSVSLSNKLIAAPISIDTAAILGDTTPPIPGCNASYPCKVKPCENNGTCVDKWTEALCLCKPSYGGDRCQQLTTVHLSSEQPITFNFSTPTNIFNISFQITSNSSYGLVLFREVKTAFALYVNDWTLILKAENPERNVTLSGMRLNDSGWYDVKVVMNQEFISMTVTSVDTRKYITDIGFFQLNNEGGPLYVGSPGNKFKHWGEGYSKSFTGCMRYLKINSVEQNWTVEHQFLNLVTSCPRVVNCKSFPCKEGICSSSWNDFTCSSDPVVSYRGASSYTLITVDSSHYAFGRNISWDMKTLKSSAKCLMSMVFLTDPSSSQSSYICVEIDNGTLYLTTSNQTQSITSVQNHNTGLKMISGNWNNVSIATFAGSYNVSVNGDSAKVKTNVVMFSSRFVNVSIGEVPASLATKRDTTSFEGCISNLKLNVDDVVPPSNSSGPFLNVTSSASVNPTCQSVDPCTSNPCFNSGQCIEIGAGNFSCTCLPEWTGPLCLNSSCGCQNNGTCFANSTSRYCACQPGYTGLRCEVQSCQGSPCENNGTCKVVNGNSSCECPQTHVGSNCSIKNPCLENKCSSNSTCKVVNIKDNVYDYICDCSNSTYGRFCEFENSCKLMDCLKYRNCSNISNFYKCPCTVKNDSCLTHDTLCDSSNKCSANKYCYITESLDVYCQCKEHFAGVDCKACTYCKNGGECVDVNGTLSCNCTKTNYSGSTCDSLKDNSTHSCSPNPCNNSNCCKINSTNCECSTENALSTDPEKATNSGLAVGLGVGIPLFVLAAIGGYALYQREQKLRGNYKPKETEQDVDVQSPIDNSRPFTISDTVSGRNELI